MHRFLLVLTICFLLTNLYGQSISIAPQIVYSTFDSRSNIEYSTGYGLNLVSSLSERISISLLYRFTPTRQTFSTPAGDNAFPINMHLYGIQFSTPLMNLSTKSGTSLFAGTGGATFTIASRIIDLGALGNLRLDPESTTQFAYWIGLSVNYYLFSSFVVHLQPHVIFTDSYGTNYTNYMFAGGVALEL